MFQIARVACVTSDTALQQSLKATGKAPRSGGEDACAPHQRNILRHRQHSDPTNSTGPSQRCLCAWVPGKTSRTAFCLGSLDSRHSDGCFWNLRWGFACVWTCSRWELTATRSCIARVCRLTLFVLHQTCIKSIPRLLREWFLGYNFEQRAGQGKSTSLSYKELF